MKVKRKHRSIMVLKSGKCLTFLDSVSRPGNNPQGLLALSSGDVIPPSCHPSYFVTSNILPWSSFLSLFLASRMLGVQPSLPIFFFFSVPFSPSWQYFCWDNPQELGESCMDSLLFTPLDRSHVHRLFQINPLFLLASYLDGWAIMTLSFLDAPGLVEKIHDVHTLNLLKRSFVWLWPFDLSEVLTKDYTVTYSAFSLWHIFSSHSDF